MLLECAYNMMFSAMQCTYVCMLSSLCSGHPVWNLRTKTPKLEQAVVPWHQDNAYLDPSCLGTLQLTAWIPLIDANANNGCMQVRGVCACMCA